MITLVVGVRAIDWNGVGGTTVSDTSPLVAGNVPDCTGPSPLWHALINNAPRRAKPVIAIKRRRDDNAFTTGGIMPRTFDVCQIKSKKIKFEA